MASFNTSEGSWGDGLQAMKKQAERLAEDAALAHAAYVNGGKVPLCDVCRQYISNGKAAEYVNSGSIQGNFHEVCFRQAKFLNKDSVRI